MVDSLALVGGVGLTGALCCGIVVMGVSMAKPLPFLIGVGHKARQGKDSLSHFIARGLRERGVSAQQRGFADALKDEVTAWAAAFGGMEPLFRSVNPFWSPKEIPDWVRFDPNAPMNEPHCGLGKQRELLQWYGTWRRSQDNAYWIKRLEQTLRDDHVIEVAVIADLRFPNEHNWITAHQGTTIRVIRPGAESVHAHISETALDDTNFSMTVENSGDLEALAKKASAIVNTILDGHFAKRSWRM
jgi:hypothetical protein